MGDARNDNLKCGEFLGETDAEQCPGLAPGLVVSPKWFVKECTVSRVQGARRRRTTSGWQTPGQALGLRLSMAHGPVYGPTFQMGT